MMLVGTFAFANGETKESKIDVKESIEINDFTIKTSITMDDDICTITVTVTLSNGVVARGRATSNTGDCDAAESAARAAAFALLAEIGF